jgi:hypothetical protein
MVDLFESLVLLMLNLQFCFKLNLPLTLFKTLLILQLLRKFTFKLQLTLIPLIGFSFA